MVARSFTTTKPSVDDALHLVPGDLVFFGEEPSLPSKTYGFTPYLVANVEQSASGAVVRFGTGAANDTPASTAMVEHLAHVTDLNQLAALIAQFPQSRWG